MNSIALLERLIRFPSVSSTSNTEISDAVAQQLSDLGFQIELVDYCDAKGVAKRNVIAKRDPSSSQNRGDVQSEIPKGIAYFAHTDVVPADRWVGHTKNATTESVDPFEPQTHADRIYGRGSCDMKGSLAAMISAVRSVDASSQSHPIWITTTADEEIGFAGARRVVSESKLFREMVDCQPLAIIGEPTELQLVHAHKGVAGFEIIAHGRAAHSSSRDGINSNEKILSILNRIDQLGQLSRQDQSLMNDHFDPPHLSWTYGISDSMKTINITPSRSRAWVSLRPMPGVDGSELIAEIAEQAKAEGLEMNAFGGGPPLWTDPESPTVKMLATLTDSTPSVVCYGTDGSIFSELTHRVILGPGGILQAHTVDEWISLQQMEQGVHLYEQVIRQFAGTR